jgi:SseB protein N-terminal domain/SseB protein C-terminal domain
MGFFDFLPGRKVGENAGLERVMTEMSARPDIKVRRVLYQELLKGTLLLPTPGPAHLPPGGAPLKEVQVVTRPGAPGETVWIAFTGLEPLRLWWGQPGSPHLAVKGEELFPLALRNRVDTLLINPAGPIGGRLTRMEIQMLAERTIPMEDGGGLQGLQAGAGSEIRIGPPSRLPEAALVDYLRAEMGRNRLVRAGYLAAIEIGSGAPHWLLALQFEPAQAPQEAKAFLEGIGSGASAFLKHGEFMDLVPLEEGHEWLETVRKCGIPVRPEN